MTKDEIIELLKGEIQSLRGLLTTANNTVSSLTNQVGELTNRIASLEALFVQKGVAVEKMQRQNKALGK